MSDKELRMELMLLLDDERFLLQMGLPLNISKEEKERIIDVLIKTKDLVDRDLNTFNSESHTKPDNISPAEWLVNDAINEMQDNGFIFESKFINKERFVSMVLSSDLKENEIYKIEFPIGITIIAKFKRIENTDDYIFENIEGGETLLNLVKDMDEIDFYLGPLEFPIPRIILENISMYKEV